MHLGTTAVTLGGPKRPNVLAIPKRGGTSRQARERKIGTRATCGFRFLFVARKKNEINLNLCPFKSTILM